mmetsp:Transcript_64620/g.173022  ORF Transcript_64620/g.173022 Transcript_64620/m.173022 type:complete len:494 (+) Transcript_64620:1014-2495(+)
MVRPPLNIAHPRLQPAPALLGTPPPLGPRGHLAINRARKLVALLHHLQRGALDAQGGQLGNRPGEELLAAHAAGAALLGAPVGDHAVKDLLGLHGPLGELGELPSDLAQATQVHHELPHQGLALGIHGLEVLVQRPLLPQLVRLGLRGLGLLRGGVTQLGVALLEEGVPEGDLLVDAGLGGEAPLFLRGELGVLGVVLVLDLTVKDGHVIVHEPAVRLDNRALEGLLRRRRRGARGGELGELGPADCERGRAVAGVGGVPQIHLSGLEARRVLRLVTGGVLEVAVPGEPGGGGRDELEGLAQGVGRAFGSALLGRLDLPRGGARGEGSASRNRCTRGVFVLAAPGLLGLDVAADLVPHGPVVAITPHRYERLQRRPRRRLEGLIERQRGRGRLELHVHAPRADHRLAVVRAGLELRGGAVALEEGLLAARGELHDEVRRVQVQLDELELGLEVVHGAGAHFLVVQEHPPRVGDLLLGLLDPRLGVQDALLLLG